MNWVVGILLDIVLIFIVVLFFRKGKKDGFAKTLVGFLGFFIAIVVAAALCRPAADFAYTSFVQKPVETAVETAIRGQAESIQQSAPSVDNILDAFDKGTEKTPKFLVNLLNVEEKRAELSQKLNKVYTTDITALSQKATETIVKPIVISSLTAIVFVVLFFALMIICKILSKALKLVNKLPLLGGINAFLGGLLGALKGIIVVLIINWVIAAFVLDGSSVLFGIITAETVKSSLIMKNLALINPLSLILEKITVA